MTIYVDDMYRYPMGRFGRMKMSHMVSDKGEEELRAFANRIGLREGWIQCPGSHRSRVHYDVSMSMRARAIDAGAVQLSMHDLAHMCRRWKQEDLKKEANDE